MAQEVAPLTEEERAELEALRAEKAARAAREQAARERAELEALRAEQTQASRPAQRPVRTTSAAQAEEDRQIREARERGAKLMEPDDDLRMPLGQKIVLAVIALLTVLVVGMHFLVG